MKKTIVVGLTGGLGAVLMISPILILLGLNQGLSLTWIIGTIAGGILFGSLLMVLVIVIVWYYYDDRRMNT